MNKFEQVSSDHHQMSLLGDKSPGVNGGEYLYHVTYPMMHLMLPIPMNRQMLVKM